MPGGPDVEGYGVVGMGPIAGTGAVEPVGAGWNGVDDGPAVGDGGRRRVIFRGEQTIWFHWRERRKGNERQGTKGQLFVR